MKKIKLLFILLLLFAILIVCYSQYIEPERLVVKEITVETNMEIETCRIAFLTDTHFGALYDEKHIERIVEMINGLDADIVIFGGDLLDNYARDKETLDMEYLQKELSRIKANDGKYAVFGNHDYEGSAFRIYESFMNACGVHVLDDETIFLEKFNIEIMGFDDYLLGQTEADFYHIQSNRFHLIVTHEPIIQSLLKVLGIIFWYQDIFIIPDKYSILLSHGDFFIEAHDLLNCRFTYSALMKQTDLPGVCRII